MGVGDEGSGERTNGGGEGTSAGPRCGVGDSGVDARLRGGVGGSGRGVVSVGVIALRSGGGHSSGFSVARASSSCGRTVHIRSGRSNGARRDALGWRSTHLLYEPCDLVRQRLVPCSGLLQDADGAVAREGRNGGAQAGRWCRSWHGLISLLELCLAPRELGLEFRNAPQGRRACFTLALTLLAQCGEQCSGVRASGRSPRRLRLFVQAMRLGWDCRLSRMSDQSRSKRKKKKKKRKKRTGQTSRRESAVRPEAVIVAHFDCDTRTVWSG